MRRRTLLVVSGLAIVLTAQLIELGRLLRRPRRAPPPLAADGPRGDIESDGDGDVPLPPLEPRRVFASAPPTGPAPALRRRGVAHLRVRVLGEGGAAADGDDVSVAADDGTRSFDAQRAGDAGWYELHIPPGRYVVTATSGEQIGLASVVAVAAAAREVTVSLRPGAEVRGRLRGAEQAGDVTLTAYRADTRIEVGTITIDGDQWSATGLTPGRLYDFAVDGEGVRPFLARGIAAPGQGVELQVTLLAVLRGAVGLRDDAECPAAEVRLTSVADDNADPEATSGVELDDDCRFELPVPPGLSSVLVIATGPGWHIEEEVSVPPFGDPEPVCLNAPCGAIRNP